MNIGDKVEVAGNVGHIGNGKIAGFPSSGRISVRLDSVYLDGQISIEAPTSRFAPDQSDSWILKL